MTETDGTNSKNNKNEYGGTHCQTEWTTDLKYVSIL